MAKRADDRGEATPFLKTVAAAVLRVMREHGELDFDTLVREVGRHVEAKGPSVRRACNWLRDQHDAPLRYDASGRCWVLDQRDYALPLLDPTPDDIVAVAFAAALLRTIGDAALDRRMHSLLEELDERASAEGKTRPLHGNAVVATSSTITDVTPRVVSTLARAVGRDVVRIGYVSPWSDRPETRMHVIEPWQLRFHDGELYVRGWQRKHAAASTFRVAQITSAVVTGEATTQPRPPAPTLWGALGPSADVDDDRPDVGTVHIRGAMARYVASSRWHGQQEDTWLEDDELLQRRFPYASCRATARRLLALGDALVRVEPAALRQEVTRHAEALTELA
jgi:predicted DNA-binding transcriptional regulator YafY